MDKLQIVSTKSTQKEACSLKRGKHVKPVDYYKFRDCLLCFKLQSSAHEDMPRTARRPITLRYSIEPKIVNGSFLVYARYSFCDPGSERLCVDLRSLAFRICPHINTFSKGVASHCPLGSEKPLLTLPDPLMSCATGNSDLGLRRSGLHTIYKDSCWYCATDYSVKLAYHGESPRCIAEVVIDAWHEIGPKQVTEGDEVCAKWHEWDHFLANIRIDT